MYKEQFQVIDYERKKLCFFESLNDDKNSFFCSKVLEKIYPERSIYCVNRMEVQQQTGTDDCGLFACAYLELISQAILLLVSYLILPFLITLPYL